MQFYDQLAADYHLLFEDWQRTVRMQSELLDRIIREQLGDRSQSILDCCCGIGTQSIALALRGHRVRGADISASAVERARREAVAAGVAIEFEVADVRMPRRNASASYDAVIACDNALPHILSDEELLAAVRTMASELRPGGLFLATTRDYDTAIRERPSATPVRVFSGPSGRRVVFQIWNWAEDSSKYGLTQFLLTESPGGWSTEHFKAEYRPLQREELSSILRQLGFVDIHWRMPQESGFYQPLVTARKHAASNAS